VAGAIEFNLANVHRKRDQYSEAVTYLQRAFGHRSYYETDPLCWGLLGGAAFRAGQYSLSAEAYSKGLELDASVKDAQMHFADALLWAGQYRRSAEVIDGAYGSALTDKLSVVNRLALREIAAVLELDHQERRSITDEEIEGIESGRLNPLTLLKTVDALEPGLWMQLEPDPVQWDLTRAALVARLYLDNASVWALAVIRASEAKEAEDVLNQVIDMAINDAGDDFVDALEKGLDPEEKWAAALLGIVHSRALSFSRPTAPFMFLDSTAQEWHETSWTSQRPTRSGPQRSKDTLSEGGRAKPAP
jgi:tetratricopeptide (TPR) repeat protein